MLVSLAPRVFICTPCRHLEVASCTGRGPLSEQGRLCSKLSRNSLDLQQTPFLYLLLPARFEDFEPLDTRVQYFWEALNNFTNGE